MELKNTYEDDEGVWHFDLRTNKWELEEPIGYSQ
jgi:hypothetical protein